MLTQTKTVYDALMSVGLKRGEFSAQCERNTFYHQGKRFVEYSSVNIVLWIDKKRALKLSKPIADTGVIDVVIYRINGRLTYPHFREGTGKYIVKGV